VSSAFVGVYVDFLVKKIHKFFVALRQKKGGGKRGQIICITLDCTLMEVFFLLEKNF